MSSDGSARTRQVRALVVRQPWASQIVSGEKTVELRSWRTRYRGLVLVVAGVKPWGKERSAGPLGAAIGICELVSVREARAADAVLAGLDPPEGWWAWELSRAQPLIEQVPTRGCLGVYYPSAELLEQCRWES